MYKKTFLSIAFSGQKLHLLQLSQNKKQVLRFGMVDIPKGVIQNYKVTDIAKLGQVIKSAYKQFKFADLGVGIVVPEFSTYTRVLNMPHLSSEELDEAVRWKMRDFLPDAGTNMLMDWKIIKQTSEGYLVMVVSILEEVLQSYVSAVVAAGLMPLVVETPSLSLARVAKPDSDARLILYSNGGESLLLATEGEEILGSVVLRSPDQISLVRQAVQMGRHFTQNPMKKLVLGGLDITQDTLKSLTIALKVPVGWFEVPIKGLTPPQVQEFLTTISLQLMEAADPSDTKTINLLPIHWAKLYQDRHTKDQIWSLSLLTSVVIWICLIATLAANLFITTLSSSSGQSQQANSTPSDLVAQVNTINQNADYINKVASSQFDPAAIINSITASKPVGVVLSNYEVNLEQGTISLTGTSLDRESLVVFKNSLEENKDFGRIDIPITALAQENNISFTLDFSYVPAEKKVTKAPAKIKLQ